MKSQAPKEDAPTRFGELFWRAREAQLSKRRPDKQNSTAFSKARVFALSSAIPSALRLLDCLKQSLSKVSARNVPANISAIRDTLPRELQDLATFVAGTALRFIGDFHGALGLLTPLTMDGVPIAKRGELWHHLGLTYKGLGYGDDAERCYNEALHRCGNTPTKGSVLLSLGRYFYDRGLNNDYANALKVLREATKIKNFAFRGRAHHEIGLVHFELGEYARAEQAFAKACELSHKYKERSLNALGNVAVRRKAFAVAIRRYKRAINAITKESDPRENFRIRINLADALRLSGKLTASQAELAAVLTKIDCEHPERERANAVLRLCRRRSSGKKLTEGQAKQFAEEDALVAAGNKLSWDYSRPETRIRAKLLCMAQKREEYANMPASEKGNSFTILRGWGSSTTLFEGAMDGQWLGGGYFLKWRDFGTVIDPGFDFLYNFHREGFHAKDIHSIIVSHDHPDHNADLRSLEALLSEIGAERYCLVVDSKTVSSSLSKRDRFLKYTVPRSSKRNGTCTRYKDRLRWSLEHFAVKHSPGVANTAFGFLLRLHDPSAERDFLIGYTSDTRFWNGLADKLHGCDLLIAHISGVRARELSDESEIKEDHLGFNGVATLVSSVQPKLTLVGEFWAGLADVRLDLIQALRLKTNTTSILPAGLGLSLDLPSLNVICNGCERPVPADRISVGSATSAFGPLMFRCDNCWLPRRSQSI